MYLQVQNFVHKMFLTSCVFSCFSAYGSDQFVWMRKSSSSGFVPPQYVQNESCNFYSDRVEVSRTWGTLTTTEIFKIETIGSISSLVDAALLEPVRNVENGLCDGPSTSTAAFSKTAPHAQSIILFETGGCGTAGKEREGPASWALKGHIDKYCPTTHKKLQP
jgi:hypothetical protein